MQGFWEWLQARVANMVIRAVVAADDDGPKMQLLKVLGRAGEIKEGVEHFQIYGLSFRVLPPDSAGRGAETVVLALEDDLRVCLPAADRRFRPSGMAPGEVMLHDDQSQQVYLKRDGVLVSTPADKSITLQCGASTVTISDAAITLGCGASSIVIADAGITYTAPAIDMEQA